MMARRTMKRRVVGAAQDMPSPRTLPGDSEQKIRHRRGFAALAPWRTVWAPVPGRALSGVRGALCSAPRPICRPDGAEAKSGTGLSSFCRA